MNIRFIPVSEIDQPLSLSIGLSGASGTGKTYTALLIARGIAQETTGQNNAPIAFIDTENRRALHYAKDFPEMLHLDLQAVDEADNVIGFGPERWIEAIDAAEKSGASVVVIDSFSHSWEGVGGILDMQAAKLDSLVAAAEQRSGGRYAIDASRFSEQAWIEPKTRYRRLVDRIVRAKLNVIICNRAKPVRQTGIGDKATNSRDTKLRRKDVPWDISGDASLIFDMTVSVVLDPRAQGCPVHQIKVADQFKHILDPRKPMGVDTGRAMAEWAKGNTESKEQKAAFDLARLQARKGSDAFRQWWQSDEGRAKRGILAPIHGELSQITRESDAEIAAQLLNKDDAP